MMKRVLSWLLIIAVILAVAAWFYPPGKIELRRRSSEADASLRAMESLRAELAKIPALAPADTGFIQPGLARVIAPENAAFVHAEDLADLSKDAIISLRFCESQLQHVAFLVRNGRWTADDRLNPILDTPGWIDEHIDYLKGLKYLFVIRRQDFTAPKLGKMAGFEPGYFNGDVILFEIPTKKVLGHFWIEGSNGNWVESHETPKQALLTDLGNKVRTSLDERVTGWFPAFKKGPDRYYATCSMY